MATNQNRRRATLLFSLTVAICLTVLILPIAAADLYRKPAPSPEPVLVSQNPPNGTYFDHLVFIIMENEGINDICGQSPPPCNGSNTPYMSALANQYGIDQQYLRVGAGTSQPQYIAIMAASQQNCTNGCGTSGTLHAVNLVDRLESAGLSWKAYMEDQGASSGCVSSDTGFYQAIHNPFVSFNDIFTNPTRCSNIVLANPSGCGTTTDCGLINDLNSGSAPNFMWLTPNNCDNMHAASGCPNGCTSAFSSTCLKDGDNYLKSVANNILNSTTFKTTNSALFITFDEGNGFCPGPFPSGEDCMYNVWSGTSAKTSYSNSTLFNHYSFTKTIEANWGLSTMTTNDASATPMTAFLRAQTSADFSISASPTSVNVVSGAQATSTITLDSLNGFTGTVSLAASSSPTGPTLNLNPTSVTLTSGGSGSSTLTFTSSTTGNYTITVTGTSGSLQHTTTVTVHVQDYSIISSPTSIKTNSGTQGTSTITVSPINHFTGTVSLSATGTTGLTVSINPTSISGGSGTATLTASSSTTGNYTATVTSTSGSLTHTVTVNVQVVSFTITATSPSPVNAGISASSTITVTAVNHFTSTIALTDTVPSGLTCGTITPSSITGSGTATVSCNATTFGNYTLSITGTSGSLTHTATALFQVRDFTLTANPANITANAGSTATSTITITDQNGFVAVVNLSTNSTSCSVNPTSVAATGSSTLSCTFTSAGTFHVAVTGTSGTLSHTGTVTFKIQNFTLAASPTAITVDAGSAATSTITVSSLNGFTGIVNLTTNSTLCTLAPTSVTGSGSSTLSCTSTSASTFHVNVTGTNGSLSHSAVITFTAQDFTLAASPSTVTANANASAVSTITLSPLNGFTGVVTLATNSTSCTISPNSLTGSGSSTLTCTFTTAGTRHVAVTGTNGNLSHNATLTFKIQDFTVTASPTSLTVNINASGNSTISIAALNAFSGVVNLATNSTSCTLSKSSVTGSGSTTLSCTFTTTGNFHVAVTGTSASLSHSVTVTCSVQDFSITASPTSLTTNVNATATSSISVSAVNSFAGIVSLTTNATSSSCSVSPSSINGSGSSTLSCSFTTSGNRHVLVTGTSGGLSHSATVTFVVQDFFIIATPTSLSVNANATGVSSITITSINGFGGVVNLATNSTSCGVSPTSVTGSGSTALSCTFAAVSNVHVQLTGTNGSLSHGVTVIFVVQDFTITASPANVTVNVNAQGISTISAVGQNGFAGTVSLATNSTSCTVSPTKVIGSGTTTLSCNISTTGTFHIGVTGTNASLSHSLTITYNVQDFTITASPTSVKVNVGATGKATITITAINSFNGLVSLTTNSTSCILSPSSVRGSGSSTLSCTFTSVSNVPIKIIGSNSTLSHSVTVTFTVQDFTITATAASPANVGNSLSTTITLNSLDQFAATINITDTIPAGLSCGTISPSSVSGSGTATLSCTSSAAGNYTVTMTGTSSNLIHSANSTFRYQDYTITASVPSIVNAHGTVSATLTIGSLNGFIATVNLSDSIPTGLTCSTISPITLTGAGTAGVSCSAMVGGNYTLTLTGTSAPLAHSTTTTFRFADFTITATNPPATDIGRNVNSIITVSALNQFSTMVSLSTSMPIGVFCNPPSPAALLGSGSSTLTCSTNTSGNYTLQVRGTAGNISHITTITIRATDYTMNSNPTVVTTPVAANATSTITLTSLNGYNGNITLISSVQAQSTTSGAGGLGGNHPFYMTAPAQLPDPIITPNSLILNSSTTRQSILTVVVPTGTQAGNYTVTIAANDGALWHNIQLTLAVTDFSLTTPTTNIIQAPGTNSTTTLTLQSLNTFQGNITISTSINPSGPTATTSPSQLYLTSTSSSMLTVTVAPTTPPGNYTLTIQASSGSILHTLSIRITVKIGPTSIFVKMLSPSTSVPAGIGAVLALLCMIAIRAVQKERAEGFEPQPKLNRGRRSYHNKTRWVQTSNLLLSGPVWTRLERS